MKGVEDMQTSIWKTFVARSRDPLARQLTDRVKKGEIPVWFPHLVHWFSSVLFCLRLLHQEDVGGSQRRMSRQRFHLLSPYG